MAIRLQKDQSIKLKLHTLLSKIPDYSTKSYLIADDSKYYYIWHEDFKKSLKTIKAMGFEIVESPVTLVDTKYENIFPVFEKKEAFISKRVIVRIEATDVSTISQYLFESGFDKFHITKANNHFYILAEDAPLYWTHSIMFFSKFVVFTERKTNIFVRSNEDYAFSDILTKEQSGYYVIEKGNSIFISADSFKFSYDIVNFKFNLDKVKSETKEFNKIDVSLSLKMVDTSNKFVSLWKLTENDIERIPELIDMLSEAEKDLISIAAYEMDDGDIAYFARVNSKVYGREVYAKALNFFNGESYYAAYDNVRIYVVNGFRIFPDVDSRAIIEVANASQNYISIFDGGDNHHALISLKDNCFVPLSKSYTVTSLRHPKILESIYSSIHFSFEPAVERARKESAQFSEFVHKRVGKNKDSDIFLEKNVLNPHFETASKGGIRGSIWGKIYDEYKHPSVYARACLFSYDKIKKHDDSYSKYIKFLNSDDVYDDKKVKNIINEMQNNIRTIHKHFYWFFMKELAAKLNDSLLLQQQKEFMFKFLNANSMQEIDFPPFVVSSVSEDEIEKDSFASTIGMIVNHSSIPNQKIRYLLFKIASLALSFNNETLPFKIGEEDFSERLHQIIGRKVDDRTELVKSGKPEESDWVQFLEKSRKSRDAFYVDSATQDTNISNVRFIVDSPLEKEDTYMRFLKEILSGGNIEKNIAKFAEKNPSRDHKSVFFTSIVEKIRSLNHTDLYNAIHKHFPYSYDPTKGIDNKLGYPITALYACLYAMNGETDKLPSLKKNMIYILNNGFENTTYHALASVANICGADFVDEIIKETENATASLPTITVYIDCGRMAMMYGSGKSDALYIEANKFLDKVESHFKAGTMKAPLFVKNVWKNFFSYCSSLTLNQRQSIIARCIELSLLPEISALDKSSPNARISHISMVASIMYAVMNAGSVRDRMMRAFLSREEAALRQEIIATKI